MSSHPRLRSLTRRFAFVLVLATGGAISGCAQHHDARLVALEARLAQLESSPSAEEARAILDRLPSGEERLTTLDTRAVTLGETLTRLESAADELEEASKQAALLVERVEKIETIEQLGKYGAFLINEREQLLSLLASIEAEYRQLSRQAPGLIKAREIQIVDSRGNVLLSLGEDALGSGFLNIRSQGGKDLVSLGSSDRAAGGRIQVHHSGGAPAVDLWVDPSGAGNLQTAHRDAGVLIDLTHDEADGQLEVHSGAGPAVALGVVDGSNGTVQTWNAAGRSLVKMGSMASGGGALTVYDGNQFPVVMLRVVNEDLGKVDVLGPNGRARELRP